MAGSRKDESRAGVDFTNLDQPLFDGAGATKRDLVEYLDLIHDRILPVLRDRPLSVIRVTRGQAPFMQKNVPKYTPEWVATVPLWAEASKRTVSYALCNDRRTLLWFANQRAIEYHPTLARVDRLDRATDLVLDLDPPNADGFAKAVAAARLVRQALADVGLAGSVKSSGAKGVHVFVPIDAERRRWRTPRPPPGRSPGAPSSSTRRRPRRHSSRTTGRARCSSMPPAPGVPRSSPPTVPEPDPACQCRFPIDWDELDDVVPADFTILTAAERLGDRDPWAETLPAPQRIPAELVTEGHEIPTPRVAAMHEGKRRARASRQKRAVKAPS